MDNEFQAQVIEAENRLRYAQTHCDVNLLDELVSPDLYFTSHWGQVVRKADELAFHRAALLHLTQASPSEEHFQFHETFAVHSVLMHLIGTYQGAPIDQHIRYTRIWSRSPDGVVWLVAGHASEVHTG